MNIYCNLITISRTRFITNIHGCVKYTNRFYNRAKPFKQNHFPMVTFTRSDQKWSVNATSGLELPNHHFSAFPELRRVYVALWTTNYFQPYSRFNIKESSESLSLFPWSKFGRAASIRSVKFRSLQLRPGHATYKESKHLHSLCTSLVRRKFTPNRFFSRTATLGVGCFSNHCRLKLFKFKVNHYLCYIS